MKGKRLCLAASLCGVMLLLCGCRAVATPSRSEDVSQTPSSLAWEESAAAEKEDSAVQAVYQVQLPDDGRPVYWPHGWLENNGEAGGKGISAALDYVEKNVNYSISTYFGDEDVFIDCSMNSTTSSLDAPHLYFFLYENDPAVYFHYDTQYASGGVTVSRASLSQGNLPVLEEIVLEQDAPSDYTQPQFQQDFEKDLILLLDQMDTKLLPQVGYDLATFGFTAW